MSSANLSVIFLAWYKIFTLIDIFKTEGIVSDELDIVVVCDTSCAIISDSVNHSDTDIFNCTQQILVGDEIPGK